MASGWAGSDAAAPSAERTPSALVLARDSEADWGGLWVGLLGASAVLLLFLTFISFDLMRNLYEFRDGGPASGLVRLIAGLFGG
jgi:hypothetical protein